MKEFRVLKGHTDYVRSLIGLDNKGLFGMKMMNVLKRLAAIEIKPKMIISRKETVLNKNKLNNDKKHAHK